MAAIFTSVGRKATADLTSLSRTFNALSRFQRAYIARNIGQTSRLQLGVRTLATATTTTTKPAVKKAASGKKKNATTKTATKKKTVKKTSAPKPKKKVAKKKKVVKKPVKKSPTPKQRAAAKAKVLKETLTEDIAVLSKQALELPKTTATTPLALYISQNRSTLASGTSGTQLITSLATEYKNLSETQKEALSEQASKTNQKAQDEYTDWVNSHTPEEIRLANIARKQLRLKAKKLRPNNKIRTRDARYTAIKDPRQVKEPSTAYIIFAKERLIGHSGNAANRLQDIASEWKSISPSEKQRYVELNQVDVERYRSEYKATYGHEVTSNRYKA